MTSSRLIRTVIVEEHNIVGAALTQMINSFESCNVVAVVTTKNDLLSLLRKNTDLDVILMNITTPEMDGIKISSFIRDNYPGIKILTLAMFTNEFLLLEILKAGIKGILTKNTDYKQLEFAIKSVFEGNDYYENATTKKIIELIKKRGSKSFTEKVLSEKELAFLRLMVSDLSYKEIASELNMSVRTVEAHKEALCSRFDTKSRTGLAVYALKNGIIF